MLRLGKLCLELLYLLVTLIHKAIELIVLLLHILVLKDKLMDLGGKRMYGFLLI